MSETLKNLKALMTVKGLSAQDLHELSKVPGPTITRSLTGKHAEPQAKTVKSWAAALNVTEAQLRGLEPIDGISKGVTGLEPIRLESVLTRDEISAIEDMRLVDKQTRQEWLNIGRALCRAKREKEIYSAPKIAVGPRNTRVSGSRYRNIDSSSGNLQTGTEKA